MTSRQLAALRKRLSSALDSDDNAARRENRQDFPLLLAHLDDLREAASRLLMHPYSTHLPTTAEEQDIVFARKVLGLSKKAPLPKPRVDTNDLAQIRCALEVLATETQFEALGRLALSALDRVSRS